MKLSAAAQAAWSSPSASAAQPVSTPSYPPSLQNGVQQQQQATQQQQQAPPQQPQAAAQQQTTAAFAPTGNGGVGAEVSAAPSSASAAPAPQTPAQQVLVSPADRWGLLGLLAMIKNTDPDQTLLTIGTDLGTMGLDMQHQACVSVFLCLLWGGLVLTCRVRNLYSTFITPWADSSAAHTVEPDFHLPACYNVQPPPPGPNKAAAFSDETLFFMFYSSPRDALQEIAAQELCVPSLPLRR
jgi:CCR4-NOT transcription complex subunit 2